MAKRILMIAPFEVLTGNLSGKQDIRYASDKKAYDEPNGKAGALNYKPRFIGARRGNGKTYFSVRTKQTSVLNGKTRMQMALTAATAAIISVLKGNGVYAQIVSAWDYVLSHPSLMPEGVTTAYQWAVYNIRYMLRYRKLDWSFNQASISFSVKNPFKLDASTALQIAQSIWDKFAGVLAFHESFVVSTFSIDGKDFINPNYNSDFGTNKGAMSSYCPNLRIQWSAITLATAVSDAPVLYNGVQVYDDAGNAVNGETEPQNKSFTTIEPGA